MTVKRMVASYSCQESTRVVELSRSIGGGCDYVELRMGPRTKVLLSRPQVENLFITLRGEHAGMASSRPKAVLAPQKTAVSMSAAFDDLED